MAATVSTIGAVNRTTVMFLSAESFGLFDGEYQFIK